MTSRTKLALLGAASILGVAVIVTATASSKPSGSADTSSSSSSSSSSAPDLPPVSNPTCPAGTYGVPPSCGTPIPAPTPTAAPCPSGFHNPDAANTYSGCVADPTPLPLPGPGSTQTDSDGNTYTLVTFTPYFTSSNEFEQPQPGNHFASAFVKDCAGPKGGSYSSSHWRLQMSDGTQAKDSFAERTPMLSAGELSPGRCVSGYVTWEAANGGKAQTIELVSNMFNATAALTWTLG